MTRDASEYNEASYWPDMAQGCDTLADHVQELVGEEWPAKADPRAQAVVVRLVTKVVRRLLDEGRLAPLVDVQRLPGKELLARLLDEIINAPDAALMACSIDFVMGTGVMLGASMTKISNRFGVTKAAVSHYCRMLAETYLGGKPAAGMKSKAAVESYRRNRMGKSSRGPRTAWQFKETFTQHYGANHTNTGAN